MSGMAGVSVLVPLAGGGTRGDVWDWLRQRWRDEHPGWQVEVGTDARPLFSKGLAVRRAFQRAEGDVLVIADADCLVPSRYLDDAVERVERGTPWVMPHAVVQRLSPRATAHILNGQVRDDREWANGVYRTHPAVVGGGFVVLHRDAYVEVDGIDPRFLRWGGDDLSFGWALDLLVGPHVQLSAHLYHLWHEPGPRRRGVPTLNECLAGAYREAFEDRDVERMRRLCAREEACAA